MAEGRTLTVPSCVMTRWHSCCVAMAVSVAASAPLCRRCRRQALRRQAARCSWTPDGGDMRAVVQQLAHRALSLSAPPGQRCLVGVAGCPGGGKTTTVKAVVQAVNQLAGEEFATSLPMDGFHFSKKQLDAMPDPAAAHARRGAPFTFDAAAFVSCVRRARCTPDGVLRAPSFDHAAGDPMPDGVTLEAQPRHRLVFVEGNYVFLDTEPWCDLLPLFHDRWFVTTDPEAATQRIVRRHMAVWGSSLEGATTRAESNDAPNARLVWATRQRAAPDVWVPVLEDAAFAAGQQ